MSHSKTPRAVIFDMDGVIVDSEPRHKRAFDTVMVELGYGDNHKINFDDYVGRSDYELWRDFVDRHQPKWTLQELMAMKRRHVIDIVRKEQPIFDGLPELVATASKHFSIGLASGSERIFIEEVLSLKDLRRFFSVVVCAYDVPRGKPAPDIFLRTAELLHVPPKDCWVIEDSKPGVQAGIAAGMKVIAITNSHPAAELAGATHVVEDYKEIERLLLQ